MGGTNDVIYNIVRFGVASMLLNFAIPEQCGTCGKTSASLCLLHVQLNLALPTTTTTTQNNTKPNIVLHVNRKTCSPKCMYARACWEDQLAHKHSNIMFVFECVQMFPAHHPCHQNPSNPHLHATCTQSGWVLFVLLGFYLAEDVLYDVCGVRFKLTFRSCSYCLACGCAQ